MHARLTTATAAALAAAMSLLIAGPATADAARANPPAPASARSTAAYADLFAAFPQYTATVAMVLAEGDLVAVHTHVRDAPGDLGTSVYEIFRVQEGKIVEH